MRFTFKESTDGTCRWKLNFIQKYKRPSSIIEIFLQKNKVRGLTLPDIKIYCKAMGINAVISDLEQNKV